MALVLSQLPLVLTLQLPVQISRRCLGALGSALALPSSALAYDAVPTVSADFAALEKKRLERDATMKKNQLKIKPYLEQFSAADDEAAFIKAADDLSLWLIGLGKLPEGIDAPSVRDVIQDAYQGLPLLYQYSCEKTRTNNGICRTPGLGADAAYEAVLRELRKYATLLKGKGTLQSDGVSAANSAAF